MVHVYLGGQGREITSSGQTREYYYYYYLACVCLCVFVCVSHVWMPKVRATGNSEANVDAGTELISSRRAANVLND